MADWGHLPTPPDHIDGVPLIDQPATLDQAPLHFCLADAFHPGCELTWPMRHMSMYVMHRPFRIRHDDSGGSRPDYGDHLVLTILQQADGPLAAQRPGDLTRWMAVPWQVDTAGCRSGYERGYDPYLPSFWPARVPNQVLTAANYGIVMDTTRPIEERHDAFHSRRTWYHPLENRDGNQMALMVTLFASMGVIEARPGPTDHAAFPSTIYVETLPSTVVPTAGVRAALKGHPLQPQNTPVQREAREAGWESAEQREFFRQARFPR